MKATLEFNLPEDQEEFNDCNKTSDYKYILGEMDNYLRGECKYNENEAACKIREHLYSLLNELNITLY